MQLYGIRLLAGRLLSEDRGTDGLSLAQKGAPIGLPFNVLINASCSPAPGLFAASRDRQNPRPGFAWAQRIVTIVGVVADTKHDGPKGAVEGTVYMYWRAYPVESLFIRIRDGRSREALSFIDRTWHAFAPSVAIQRHFLEDDYNKQFLADERQGTLFGVFVGIAIFIACLGLFGLAAFSTERRTREIGLRKTFGAGTGDIVWMLLRQFSVPVLIANAIAWPVAWYYLHGWLQGFAYRIPLSPFYFLGAGAVALVIASATVFVHALRVARANPIKALRYE